MKRTHFSSRPAQRGVALTEAMVAILLFSIGVLAIAGLQTTMLQNTTASQFRGQAANIAQNKVAQLWADPGNALLGVYNGPDTTSDLPNGQISITAPVAPNQFVIVVGWTAPGETSNAATDKPCFMAVAHCLVTNASIPSIAP